MKKLLTLLLLLTFCLATFCSCSDGESPSLVGCWYDDSERTVIQFFSNGTVIEKRLDRYGEYWSTSKNTTWHLEKDGTLFIGSTLYSLEFVNKDEMILRIGDGDDYTKRFYRADFTINDIEG